MTDDLFVVSKKKLLKKNPVKSHVVWDAATLTLRLCNIKKNVSATYISLGKLI